MCPGRSANSTIASSTAFAAARTNSVASRIPALGQLAGAVALGEPLSRTPLTSAPLCPREATSEGAVALPNTAPRTNGDAPVPPGALSTLVPRPTDLAKRKAYPNTTQAAGSSLTHALSCRCAAVLRSCWVAELSDGGQVRCEDPASTDHNTRVTDRIISDLREQP